MEVSRNLSPVLKWSIQNHGKELRRRPRPCMAGIAYPPINYRFSL